jgi:hypothetical protein
MALYRTVPSEFATSELLARVSVMVAPLLTPPVMVKFSTWLPRVPVTVAVPP